ncbi:hypothetical protein R3P38DRAFT_2776504 [Favolaschia claudopus]|uniref:Uncharacterized protein n=1 Tax=Favolaschia claudopus TaxID=2862362 RepID=A0AAW0BN49_9AGAR
MPAFVKDWINFNLRSPQLHKAAFASALDAGLDPKVFLELWGIHIGDRYAGFGGRWSVGFGGSFGRFRLSQASGDKVTSLLNGRTIVSATARDPTLRPKIWLSRTQALVQKLLLTTEAPVKQLLAHKITLRPLFGVLAKEPPQYLSKESPTCQDIDPSSLQTLQHQDLFCLSGQILGGGSKNDQCGEAPSAAWLFQATTHGTSLKLLGPTILYGRLQHLGANSAQNSVALVVCFQSKTVYYFDSLNGPIDSKLSKAYDWWTDTYNCGIHVTNCIANYINPAKYLVLDLSACSEERLLNRILDRHKLDYSPGIEKDFNFYFRYNLYGRSKSLTSLPASPAKKCPAKEKGLILLSELTALEMSRLPSNTVIQANIRGDLVTTPLLYSVGHIINMELNIKL